MATTRDQHVPDTPPAPDVTALLLSWSGGDRSAADRRSPGVSPATVKREGARARAWLRREVATS